MREEQILSLSTMLDYINESSDITTFYNTAERLMFQVYRRNKNQKGIYLCENLSRFDIDDKRFLSRLGLIDMNEIKAISREYILILDKTDIPKISSKSLMQKFIADFLESFVPVNAKLRYVMFTFKIPFDMMNKIVSALNNVLGYDLNILVNRDRAEERRIQVRKHLTSELDLYKDYNQVDISKYIDELYRYKSGICNEKFLIKFHETYESIKNSTTPKDLLIYYDFDYSNDSKRDLYLLLAVTLVYYGNRRVYIFRSLENIYLNVVAQVCMNLTSYFKEDYLNYIKYLPDALVHKGDYGTYIADIIRYSAVVNVNYMELHSSSSELKTVRFDLKDLDILRLSDFFELDTLDTKILDNSRMLLEREVNELKRLLKLNGYDDNSNINGFDVFVFREKDNDTVYFGRVLDIDFSADVWYFPLNEDNSWCIDKLTLDDLTKLYPLDIFIDSINIVKDVNSKIKTLAKKYAYDAKISGESQEFINKRVRDYANAVIRNIKAYKNDYIYGIIFDYIPFYSSTDYSSIDFLKYTTLIVYHPYQRYMRGGLLTALESMVPVENLNRNKVINVFGGMDPLTDNGILLSEKLIRREVVLHEDIDSV